MSITRAVDRTCDRCGSIVPDNMEGLELVQRITKRKSGERARIGSALRPKPVAEFCHKCSKLLMLEVTRQSGTEKRTTIALTGERAQVYFAKIHHAILSDSLFDHAEVESLKSDQLLVTVTSTAPRMRLAHKQYVYYIKTGKFHPVAHKRGRRRA